MKNNFITATIPGLSAGDIFDQKEIKKSWIIGDAFVICDINDHLFAYYKSTALEAKAIPYTLDQAKVEKVYLNPKMNFVVLKTATNCYFRNAENKAIEDTDQIKDFYIEPYSDHFYRMDQYGNWYNIEGIQLDQPVFIQGDVLCSLSGKQSKKSISFRNQEIYLSPNGGLIQVGKLIYDESLNLVYYHGIKITGLGKKNIAFENGDAIQEVLLGLNDTAFILENQKTPYLINNDKIKTHVQTVTKNNIRYEVFESAKHRYVINFNNNELLTCDNNHVFIDFNSNHKIGNYDLVKAKENNQDFYMDINQKSKFILPQIHHEPICFICENGLSHHELKIRNMATPNRRFVFDEINQDVFTLNEGTVVPEEVTEPVFYSQYYGIALIDGEEKLFYKKSKTVVLLQDGSEVAAIKSGPGQKLINAISTDGEAIVIDARHSYHEVHKAVAGEYYLEEVLSVAHKVANAYLQNAKIKALGGAEERVIRLDDEQLKLFTLPADLLAQPENSDLSVFVDSPIISINFEQEILLDKHLFLQAKFLPYHGGPSAILLNRKNNRPLQMEGGSHKYELICTIHNQMIEKEYYIGSHRIIGGYTIAEDLSENELIFSLDNNSSTLYFDQEQLPILSRVTYNKTVAEWNYLLYEIRNLSPTPEYIAVEKDAPYRVLFQKLLNKESPVIVKNLKQALDTPEEISLLKRLFLRDPGYLREI